jgi:hypothetical protein
MSPIIVLAGVGIIAVFLAALFLALVIGIRRGDRRHFGNGPETMASRLLLTVRCNADDGNGVRS